MVNLPETLRELRGPAEVLNETAEAAACTLSFCGTIDSPVTAVVAGVLFGAACCLEEETEKQAHRQRHARRWGAALLEDLQEW